jgi:hypothetical protein
MARLSPSVEAQYVEQDGLLDSSAAQSGIGVNGTDLPNSWWPHKIFPYLHQNFEVREIPHYLFQLGYTNFPNALTLVRGSSKRQQSHHPQMPVTAWHVKCDPPGVGCLPLAPVGYVGADAHPTPRRTVRATRRNVSGVA